MERSFDVAVVGLGAMGSTIARFLARRGKSVVGFDRHVPPHDLGSSHGRTRMIREALHEDPRYVPMVRRAYELWRDLEHESGGKSFLVRTGGLVLGPESGALVKGALKSATEYRIPHEVLSAGKVHRRYPAFAPLEDMVAVYETQAGVLFPERIIEANLEFATVHGAELHTGETVQGWEPVGDGVVVSTSSGRYRAGHLVLAAGGWMTELLGDAGIPLAGERQVMHWLTPARFADYHLPARMPASIWELPAGKVFYTHPDMGEGVKIGWQHAGGAATPTSIQRHVSDQEDAAIFDLLRRFVPFAKGEIRGRATGLLTNTPDRRFIVDRHPSSDLVTIVSACSGHGFQFAPALAEAVVERIERGVSRLDLSPFAVGRFSPDVA